MKWLVSALAVGCGYAWAMYCVFHPLSKYFQQQAEGKLFSSIVYYYNLFSSNYMAAWVAVSICTTIIILLLVLHSFLVLKFSHFTYISYSNYRAQIVQ